MQIEKLIDILTDIDNRKSDVPVIAIFDCCRSEVNLAATSEYSHLPKSTFNVYIMYATADGYTASDGGTSGNGAFTQLLVKHMDMDGDIEDVYRAILTELRTTSRREQVCLYPDLIWSSTLG